MHIASSFPDIFFPGGFAQYLRKFKWHEKYNEMILNGLIFVTHC